MVKLDLEISEIVGLAELGRIDKTKLKKFLKAASKEDLEKHIVAAVFEKVEDLEGDPEEDPEGNPDDAPESGGL